MFSRYLKTLLAILSRTAATTRAGLVVFCSRLFYLLIASFFCFLTSLLFVQQSYAATSISYWHAQKSGQTEFLARSSSANGACLYTIQSPYTADGSAGYSGGPCYGQLGGNRYNTGTVYRVIAEQCEFGNSGYYCNPDPNACPDGTYHDFETGTCKYPQDDACDSIGASWEPASSSCKCDSPTAALVTAAGVTRCMQLRDDSCDSNSPDFKGYATFGDSAGQAVCDGRASCPDGGTPGYVGSGDTMSAICYNSEPQQNDNCDGVSGVQDGVQVCVPRVGANDPDFPDCDGVVGTFNGVKRCIDRPGGHAGCNAGETPGYAGRGDSAEFVCIPSDYKPETCPPGQYVTNAATGGFGCATASGQSKEDVAAGKTPGKATGTGTATQKDAAGNVIGTEESNIELDLTQLTEDAPSTDFKGELDEFSDSELDTLDMDTVINSFSGTNGAFTERNSLDNVSNFVLTHTIGNNTNCSGSLPFFGYTISCSKFDTYNRIVGWMIFILTMINIYNVIIRPSQSGV